MRQMIYPVPSSPVPAEPPPPLENVVIPSADGERIAAWLYEPEGDHSAVRLIFFHGNGENLETMRQVGLFEQLMELEVGFLAIDYPGYGRSSGSPSEESLGRAATGALDWLAERYPEGRSLVCGWSLGAAVAIGLTAARPGQVEGLIALSAWTSLHEVAAAHFPGWMVSLALRESYDSLGAAPEVDIPTLLIHGTQDRIIPVDQGRRLAGELQGSRWVEVSGAGHNDLMGRPEVWRELAAFVDRFETTL